MKKTFTSMILKSMCVSMGMFMASAASAQTYPDRSIKILQGFAPGGNADAIAPKQARAAPLLQLLWPSQNPMVIPCCWPLVDMLWQALSTTT